MQKPKYRILCFHRAFLVFCSISLFPPFLLSQDSPSRSALSLKIRSDFSFGTIQHDIQVDPKYCGESIKEENFTRSEDGGLAEVVVWLESERLTAPPRKETKMHQLRISDCRMDQKFLMMRPGDGVHITSSDPITHDLHFMGTRNHDRYRSLYASLSKVSIRFEHPEIIPIVDEIHPWIKAFALVFPHPFFAVSNRSGVARIENIPQGKYQLRMWHEVLGRYSSDWPILIGSDDQSLEVTWSESNNTDEDL